MFINWPALVALADDTPFRFVALSPMSKVLTDTAYSFYYQMFAWRGAGDELTDEEEDAIKAAIDLLMREVEKPMLIGAILPYAGLTVPAGCLPCDGETYLKADFPFLYDYLAGSAYIVDADSFTTPIFTNRTIIQAGDNAPGTTLGESETTLSEPQMPVHSHSYIPAVLNVDLESPGAPDIFGAGVGAPTLTGEAGGGEPHNNMQPSIAFNFCIVSGGNFAIPSPEPEVETLFGEGDPAFDAETTSAPGMLGLRFQTVVPGQITHVRVWKPAGAGTGYVGYLFDAAGTMLTSMALDDAGVGWIEAEFGSPQPIDADTDYIAAVFAPDAAYALTLNFFTDEFQVGNIIGKADGGAGERNGVFCVCADGTFPDAGFSAINFYVDVRFVADG